MPQQLAQGFASGNPADVVYMDAALFGNYAKQGSLYAYADQIEDNDDYYEPLREAFTYDGKQYCVPKDFSTLALQINTDSWTKAGLSDADVPTTWEELEAVSKKLTTGDQAGLGHRRRHRPSRRLRRPERGLVAQGRRVRRRGRTPRGHRGPRVRAAERQGRQLPDVATSSTPGGAVRPSARRRPR